MHGKVLPLSQVLFALFFFASAWNCSAQGIQYIANPPNVRITSGSAIPNQLGPFCETSIGPLICYPPGLVRAAYNFPTNLDGAVGRRS